MYRDLTRGSISRSLILFALPMMAGNMLQQFYNIADTLIVSRALGANALAAVGSAYTLMTFLTSIFLGLSMGSGALFSIYRGRSDSSSLRSGILHAFILLLSITVLINAAVYAFMEPILLFLRVPDAVRGGMREYLAIIYVGLIATSLYNYVSCLLRALGNSSVPLIFLAVSAVLNIALDLIFVLVFSWGIAGAAWATVIAQYVSAKPIYEEFEGFSEDISSCKTFDELPEACKKYIARLEEVCGCKVVMVGNGPDRSQILER